MYLKQLVLKGFKSFADRSVLSLEPGITAIVGPNGSGKSNILDAVLWVLGERNARNLRGQAMEDVIFAGSASRKPVGMAEVDLVLDNGDHTLPVDFDEVAVTRRMYRTGESEYLINGVVCRRMDVLDLLHDSGLGTGTHSIISQGHLDAVLQSKPEDRRALVEEAAGVLKHRQRKEKSARKLAQMEQHLLRVQDVTAEVERQLKPLERKAKRARTYEVVAAELSDLSLRLAVDDLRALQERWQAVLAGEAEQKERLNKAQLAAYASDAQVRDLRHELQQHQDSAGQAAEGLHRLQSAAERMDSTLLLMREKRRSIERAREENQRRAENDTQRLADARAERAEAQSAFEAARTARDEAERRRADAAARDKEAAEALSALQKDIARLQSETKRLASQTEKVQARKRRADEALSNSQADEKVVAARLADVGERAAAAAAAAEQARAQADEQAEALEQARAADAAVREKVGQAFAAAEKARSQAEGQRLEAARLAAHAAALQESEDTHLRQNKAATWMEEHAGELGLAGSLLDSVTVPEELAGVVDGLLGQATRAAFAPGADEARTALQRLAAAGVQGSAAVLDRAVRLSAAPAPPVPLPAGACMLVDRLSFADQQAGPVRALLGDVVVCTTWEAVAAVEDALPAGSPFVVVGPDGYLRDARGLRRMARRAPGTVGAVERHRQLVAARAAADEAERAAQAAEQARDAAAQALREQQKAGAATAEALAQAQGRAESVRTQAADAEKRAASLARERAQLEHRRDDVAAVLAQMRPQSQQAAEELARLEEQSQKAVADLEAARSGLAPLQDRARAASEDHTKLRLEVGSLAERCTYAERMVTARDRDIAKLAERLDRVRAALGRTWPPAALDPAVTALDAVRETVTGRIATQEQGMGEARRESAGINARIDEARRVSGRHHGEMDDATQRLSDIRVEKGRLEVQVQNAVDAIEKDRSTPLDRALELPAVEDREQAEVQADKLRRRIANMGTINPDAAQEYDELKERFDYLKVQTDDLLAARASLRKIVSVIDARMRDDFIETYRTVDANFQQIFAELFPGGSAALSLTDEDDPEHAGIEVHAQPRGKRITKLSLMSGGEKSLTALALLFAVYRTRATPFYILDEVEAALDDTNLRRLCAYWEKMRADTQLIMITHQRRTMEMADVLYGISMQSDGVTRLLSQRLDGRKGTGAPEPRTH